MDKEPTSEDQPIPPERVATGGDVAPGAGSRAGFREPLGENALEQLRRYQVMTIPPDARAAFLSAQLPGASPELLYDTLPPNAGAEHESGALELPHAEPEFEPEPQRNAANDGDPAEVDLELAAAEAAGAPDRHLRGIAIAGGILLVVALLLGWATLSGDREIQRALGRQSTPPERGERQQAALAPTRFPAALTSRAGAQATAAARPSATRPAAAAPPPFTEQKPATHVPAAPNGKALVTSPPAPSEPAADPTQPPAASSAAAPAKKFRLGSR